ncbi:hypothetical protein D3C86_1921900 [compost metagenome]
MNYPIRLKNISNGDHRFVSFGVGQHDFLTLLHGSKLSASHSFQHRFAVSILDSFHQIGGAHVACYHVVGQNACQHFFVFWFYQHVNRSFRQFIKRHVGRRKYGEWPRAR